ncbi:3-methyl-2-oxobutanoate hydroxymethyltransferase [Sedimentisphaera cyanobacteriorum]|uniref:3-methyl-2-oxobutanoate hydroxymethyltransferase n=1 Tax=Sedimentisphaera cyanobacteriorum TaxID=1940790 RepID=A0A1Q2HRM4_9BACT|nr:3-methyl-2-oxobutanoate hydroxymethyltransferase [Sedimentisphaera cyanobacteriorum]AQQ09924.1 3-methyl-2-oxobutanoate hydroxymethyltransferase [Sedimentisphaera cyanobacteriorum]
MKKQKVADLYEKKKNSERFSLITCYDYTMARILSKTGVDMLLTGDSASQMVLGENNTLNISVDMLIALTKAVRRGAPDKLVAADMPFMSYQPSIERALINAGRFAAEAEADAVKIESGWPQVETVRAAAESGICVIAHIGLRPQSIGLKGRPKAEGTYAEDAADLIRLALALEHAGAGFILLEAAARETAELMQQKLSIPLIGCGAGPACDGQVLVVNDVMGMFDGPSPKFARKYAEIGASISAAANAYHEDVISGAYPQDNECYHIKPREKQKLDEMLKDL